MGKCGIKCAIFWKRISNVVAVKSPVHVILFIVNILYAGVGTMISACLDKKFNCDQFLVGLCQFLV